jgi:L-lactate dehydrogenase complex protein LldG
MSAAREEILDRIRAATRDVPLGEAPTGVGVERSYRRRDEAPRGELLDRFAERVADYRATVHRVPRGELAQRVAGACAARGARRMVVPADLPADWRGASDGVEWVEDRSLSHEQLDGMDGVVTGCALGIAETGTIVLDGGARQGRRAITLLPDYHLCVVEEDQVVGLMPEAIAKLGDTVRESGRPVTFVSGPSATSDIELSRVEGVHGPRTLEVLIVD